MTGAGSLFDPCCVPGSFAEFGEDGVLLRLTRPWLKNFGRLEFFQSTLTTKISVVSIYMVVTTHVMFFAGNLRFSESIASKAVIVTSSTPR